nr:MAG TPA: hypothetical protein [Caudoviricetes sp.]
MSAANGEATRHQENEAGQAKDRAARLADSRVQVPGGHEARATSVGQNTPREGPKMTTINEIKDRLDAVAFAGRSYAGADRAAIAKAYTDAVTAFDQNAAVDMVYLLDRVEELQDAIAVAASDLAVAASDLADVASYVAARYAGTPDEASEIRLAIGEPIDALVNVSQGTPITPEEAGE